MKTNKDKKPIEYYPDNGLAQRELKILVEKEYPNYKFYFNNNELVYRVANNFYAIEHNDKGYYIQQYIPL